jgi:hypothetical protein
MNAQTTKVFPTFPAFPDGGALDARINHFLDAHPEARIVAVYPINLQKIGGCEAAVLVVFER